MIIKDITIENFKSLYGFHKFDFMSLDGMVKLSGPVGAGKTALAEAILWGLFGQVKGHNNPNLVSWGADSCEVCINLTSKNHDIFIKRNIRQQLHIEVDGKLVSASNKKDCQNILEEFYDVPKIAIEKMCIISFNAFNSLVSMTPYETKCFLDEIFGFRTFTEYNDEVTLERKSKTVEATSLNAILKDTREQIEHLNRKKLIQQQELSKQIDEESEKALREELVEQGKSYKDKLTALQAEFNEKDSSIYKQMVEQMTLGKKEKEYYNTFKSGKCPTCGHDIDADNLNERKQKMMEYANRYKELEAERLKVSSEYSPLISELQTNISNIKQQILQIDNKIRAYQNSLKVISENYDDLINEYSNKATELEAQISDIDIEVGEWNEMSELFTKTLRYKLLDTLIPHINASIQFYINKFEQNYKIKFDQEFKAHIFTDSTDTEIAYNDLSTGQRKSLDLTIIFGILENIIANVNFNVFFLDELFTNMDADLRGIILSVIKESMAKDRTIFVINHAEMPDDYFNHKIRVSLQNKKTLGSKKRLKLKEDKQIVVKASHYEQIF